MTRKVIIHAEITVPDWLSEEDAKWLERDLRLFTRIKIQDELHKIRVPYGDLGKYFTLSTEKKEE